MALYLKKTQLLLLLLGFVSGIPFLLTLSTLSFWLMELHVSKSVIGLFMLATTPYSLKFLWAPFLDTKKLPIMGDVLTHRRSWGILSQLCMIVAIICLGLSEPEKNLWLTGVCAFFVSFFAATQDIIMDSLRIELLDEKNSGAGAAMESVGFRLGMLTSGAGALYLAACVGWSKAYIMMACLCFIGVITFYFMPEQKKAPSKELELMGFYKTLYTSWKEISGADFFIYLVFFIFCFKGGDTILNAMSAPFFCDLGFTKIEFANVSKFFGIVMMVAGGLLGGVLIQRMGLRTTVMMGTVFQCISSLLFVVQSWVGHDLNVLFVTVGIESLSSGLCATAFIAYLSSFCKSSFAASHFTLLYAFGSFSRVFISTVAGWVANTFGWTTLFLASSLFTIPVFYSIMCIHRKNKNEAGCHLIK